LTTSPHFVKSTWNRPLTPSLPNTQTPCVGHDCCTRYRWPAVLGADRCPFPHWTSTVSQGEGYLKVPERPLKKVFIGCLSGDESNLQPGDCYRLCAFFSDTHRQRTHSRQRPSSIDCRVCWCWLSGSCDLTQGKGLKQTSPGQDFHEPCFAGPFLPTQQLVSVFKPARDPVIRAMGFGDVDTTWALGVRTVWIMDEWTYRRIDSPPSPRTLFPACPFSVICFLLRLL
jgi:hypothetical protein